MEFLKKLLAVLFAIACIGGSVSAGYLHEFGIDPEDFRLDENQVVQYNKTKKGKKLITSVSLSDGNAYKAWLEKEKEEQARKRELEVLKEKIEKQEMEKKLDKEPKKPVNAVTCLDIAKATLFPVFAFSTVATGAFVNRASGLCYGVIPYYCNLPLNNYRFAITVATALVTGYVSIRPTAKIAKKVIDNVIDKVSKKITGYFN